MNGYEGITSYRAVVNVKSTCAVCCAVVELILMPIGKKEKAPADSEETSSHWLCSRMALSLGLLGVLISVNRSCEYPSFSFLVSALGCANFDSMIRGCDMVV